MAGDETIDDVTASARARDRPVPGVVIVFAAGAPAARALPLADGALELGRGAGLDDERASRRHARVFLDGGRWRVADLESRNGTFLEGAPVTGVADARAGALVRIGRTLALLTDDVRPFAAGMAARGGANAPVVGPTLRRAWDEIARAAVAGDTLLVTGETGTGKELAASAFHDAGPNARGPFVAVNCAAIPEGVAERLLFGAKKGAFSGATADAEGYFRAADRGTLFLDELAELDAAVQGKLLRVLETREVMPLGAAQGTRVDVRVVAATTADVRGAVADGEFRRDLYFRIGKPEVQLPPLRARREEIPWLVARGLAAVDAAIGADGLAADGLASDGLFVEACVLRPWPGNVRELLGAVRRAAHAARLDRRTIVEARDLEASVGVELGGERRGGQGQGIEDDEAPRRDPTRAEVEAALRDERGNVTGAAKRLGLHRNQLRRWLTKNPAVDPAAFGAAPPEDADGG